MTAKRSVGARQSLTIFAGIVEDGALRRALLDIGINEKAVSPRWRTTSLELPDGMMRISRRVRTRPGSEFSGMILGMHNLVRQSSMKDEMAKRVLLRSIAGCPFALGLVFTPPVARGTDSRWLAALTLVERTQGVAFDGIHMLDAQGESLVRVA